MSGDPCRCGATDTWHKECYRWEKNIKMEIHYAFLIRESIQARDEATVKAQEAATDLYRASYSGQAYAHEQNRAWIQRCWDSVCMDPGGRTVHRFNDDGICLKCGQEKPSE